MRVFILSLLAFLLLACQPAVSAADNTRDESLWSDLYIRIIKTAPDYPKGYLEAWRRGADGSFQRDKIFEMCTWSGQLGPKLKEGDGQSPEGFYFVRPSAMNPHSNYHLSFNLGFPNAYDRAHGRTGSFLMVHGDCVSIGCYAMTDEGIEEIWAMMEAAYEGGQPYIRVHIFPFEMTEDNLAKYSQNPNYDFWMNLKTGWDWFERERTPPNITVVDKTYRISASE